MGSAPPDLGSCSELLFCCCFYFSTQYIDNWSPVAEAGNLCLSGSYWATTPTIPLHWPCWLGRMDWSLTTSQGSQFPHPCPIASLFRLQHLYINKRSTLPTLLLMFALERKGSKRLCIFLRLHGSGSWVRAKIRPLLNSKYGTCQKSPTIRRQKIVYNMTSQWRMSPFWRPLTWLT